MEKKVISELKNDMKTFKAKKSLVSGNQSGENFLFFTRLHSSMCIRIYIFCFKKTYKLKEEKRKTKETKEEKRKTKEKKEGKDKQNAAVVNSICGGSKKIHQ